MPKLKYFLTDYELAQVRRSDAKRKVVRIVGGILAEHDIKTTDLASLYGCTSQNVRKMLKDGRMTLAEFILLLDKAGMSFAEV